MKKIKIALAILMVLGMLAALSACGSQPAPQEDSAAGEYTLFAAEVYGYTVASDALGTTSVLTLDADGTGYLTINEDGGDVSEWTVDGENITVVSGIDTILGTIKDGVIKLDFEDGYFLYYAAPGADTSSVEVMDEDAFFEAIVTDMDAGVIEME